MQAQTGFDVAPAFAGPVAEAADCAAAGVIAPGAGVLTTHSAHRRELVGQGQIADQIEVQALNLGPAQQPAIRGGGGREVERAQVEVTGLNTNEAVELVAAKGLPGGATLVGLLAGDGQARGDQARVDAGLVNLATGLAERHAAVGVAVGLGEHGRAAQHGQSGHGDGAQVSEGAGLGVHGVLSA